MNDKTISGDNLSRNVKTEQTNQSLKSAGLEKLNNSSISQ